MPPNEKKNKLRLSYNPNTRMCKKTLNFMFYCCSEKRTVLFCILYSLYSASQKIYENFRTFIFHQVKSARPAHKSFIQGPVN